MGKKTKKTKWRTLEISLPVAGKNYHENGANMHWDDGWRVPSHKYRRAGAGDNCDKLVKTSSTCVIDIKNPSFNERGTKTLDEDEYTKITTPRQDVLFKKGYLAKRQALRYISDENIIGNVTNDGATNSCVTRQDFVNNGDEQFCDYANTANDGIGDEISGLPSLSQMHPQPQLVCAASQPYMDASSAAIYYGGSYEIYDPYTGSLTALVVGAASSPNNSVEAAAATAACQPILTSMPCRPVPLQSLQWFNPVPSSSEWCCGAYTRQNDASSSSSSPGSCAINAVATGIDDVCAQSPYFGDPSIVNMPTCESSSTVESTTPKTGADSSLYPHPSQSYTSMYPNCAFATPVYDAQDDDDGDGGSEHKIQYDSPASPIWSANQFAIAATKRKKKRKRRRRLEGTEDQDDSESGVEENSSPTDGCLIGDEYVCDPAYVDDDDDDAVTVTVIEQQQRRSYSSASYVGQKTSTSSLPHASVNAPPFVPCDRTLYSNRRSNPNPESRPHLLQESKEAENYIADVVECESASAIATVDVESNKGLVSSSSTDNRHKSLADSPSSCSNSDSGISSPASDDFSSIVAQRQRVEFKRSVKTDLVVAAAGNACAPLVNGNVDSSAVSCSAEANSGKRDRMLKKTPRMKNCTVGRVLAMRCRSENEECNGKLDATAVGVDGGCAGADVRCTPYDDRDGHDENIPTVENTVVTLAVNRPNEENQPCEKSPMMERTIAITDGESWTFNHHEEQPQRSSLTSFRDECEYVAGNKDGIGMVVVELINSKNDVSGNVSDFTACGGGRPSSSLDDQNQSDAASSSTRPLSHFSFDDGEEALADTGRECVAMAARAIVEDVVRRAEERILTHVTTNKKCDKLRLPLTQAVTNWLNEHGGPSSVVIRHSFNERRHFFTQQRVDEPDDDRSTSRIRSEDAPLTRTDRSVENSKASSSPVLVPPSSSNCVIC